MLCEGGPIIEGKDGQEEDGAPAKGKKGKTNAKAKNGDMEGVGSGDYAIEYAKSSRSTCKSCDEKIEKGQVSTSRLTC